MRGLEKVSLDVTHRTWSSIAYSGWGGAESKREARGWL